MSTYRSITFSKKDLDLKAKSIVLLVALLEENLQEPKQYKKYDHNVNGVHELAVMHGHPVNFKQHLKRTLLFRKFAK